MPPDFSLGFPAPEITTLEVVQAGRVDGPEVPLAVGCPSGLDKAVVEGQVVPDGVSPTGSPVPEVRKVVKDVLIDVCKD